MAFTLMVREGGLEPPCPHGHTDLNRARLPISPLAQTKRDYHSRGLENAAVGRPSTLSD
jgi:hypothetical protein